MCLGKPLETNFTKRKIILGNEPSTKCIVSLVNEKRGWFASVISVLGRLGPKGGKFEASRA